MESNFKPFQDFPVHS